MSKEDEPSECIAPCGVDALHEGVTLYPFCAPIAFTIQRRTVHVGTPQDLALGRSEMERGQQVLDGGQTLNVGKMAQDLGEAVCVQVRGCDGGTEVMKRQVGADQLSFGPSVELDMRVWSEEGL